MRAFYPFLDFGLALATAIPQALFQNFRFDGDVDDMCLRIAASGFFDNGAGNVDDDNPALFQVIVDLWGDSVRQVVGVPMESEPASSLHLFELFCGDGKVCLASRVGRAGDQADRKNEPFNPP